MSTLREFYDEYKEYMNHRKDMQRVWSGGSSSPLGTMGGPFSTAMLGGSFVSHVKGLSREPLVCSACSEAVPEGERFCPECGVSIFG